MRAPRLQCVFPAIAVTLLVAYAVYGDGGELVTASYPTALPAGVSAAPALAGLPAGSANVDYVDIGDEASESGYTLVGWGPAVGTSYPGTGAWGGEGTLRAVWEPAAPDTDLDRSSSITLDFGATVAMKYIAVRWLDGIANDGTGPNDSIEVTVQDVATVFMLTNGTASHPENWMNIGVWEVGSVTGSLAVTLNATGPPWSGFNTYGQVGISEIATFTGPPYGACCLSTGACVFTTEDECGFLGGGYLGAEVPCEGDADGDGVDGECGDDCPDDPNKVEPGICGCGVPDDDSDGDGVADCNDQCPGEDDTVDADGNGVPDCLEGPDAIPTVSAWGMLILALLLLIGGRTWFRRRQLSSE